MKKFILSFIPCCLLFIFHYSLFIICCLLLSTTTHAQNHTGIGTTSPLAGLHVADSSVLFSVQGALLDTTRVYKFADTTRHMWWYADKSAFRTGYADSNSLNSKNVGLFSFGAGYQAKAPAVYAAAFGALCVANKQSAMAFGGYSQATGDYSVAFGYLSKTFSTAGFVTGYACTAADYATAMGYQSSAGSYSTALGGGAKAGHTYTTAFGASSVGQQYGTSMGKYTTVFGNALTSNAFGDSTLTNGWYSVAMGHATRAPDFACLTLGRWNTYYTNSSSNTWVASEPVILVGGGVGNTASTRKDIFILDKSGNLKITGTFTQFSDERLKKTITPLQNCLQKITALNGYNYYWKSKLADSTLQSGVLAQEIEKLMPELVNSSMNYTKGVNYSGITPYLVEAIKELNRRIEDLDALTAEYNILKAHHDEMAKRMERLTGTK